MCSKSYNFTKSNDYCISDKFCNYLIFEKLLAIIKEKKIMTSKKQYGEGDNRSFTANKKEYTSVVRNVRRQSDLREN